MAVEIDCPICGKQLSDVISMESRSLKLGEPERVETIDSGRCRQCSVRLQRRRGEGKFWWYPTCAICNAEMGPAGPGGQPQSLLYQCRYHALQTWTYRPNDMGTTLR